jgi:hypothetical protein
LAKTLELQFATEMGGTARIVVDNPKEPIDVPVVKQSMEDIIAADIFYATTGNLVAIKGSRLIDRKVTDYEIL